MDQQDVGPATKEFVTKDTSRPYVRKWLAYGLVIIFGLEIIGAFAAFMLGKPIDDIKALLLEVIGPTSALVGSAAGFYFGASAEN